MEYMAEKTDNNLYSDNNLKGIIPVLQKGNSGSKIMIY